MKNRNGMTLVELMVSLVVILMVVAGASTAYLKISQVFRAESKTGESYMENLCGLEMLRYDVEMAGFGLPNAIAPGTGTGPSYTEAASATTFIPNPNTFNDAPANVPRPFILSNNGNTAANTSDVLVVKSTVADLNPEARKWSTMSEVSSGVWAIQRWDSTRDFSTNARIIVLQPDNSTNPPIKWLVLNGTNSWHFKFKTSSPDFYTNASAFYTSLTQQVIPDPIYLIYGLHPDIPGGGTLRMPFNRVDYYLRRVNGQFPSRCDPTNSYTLYRSTINQTDGTRTEQPLLDCVNDFQVAFGFDENDDNLVEVYRNDLVDGSGTPKTRAEIRSELRELRVFVIYHEGARDRNYRTTQPISAQVGGVTLKTFTPSGDSVNYRWKLATLVVKPLNLR